MQDIDDDASTHQYVRSSNQESSGGKRGPGQTGFVVQGAPWEQQPAQQQVPQQQQRSPVIAPNTLSNEEFPSFGDSAGNSSTPLWGPRR